MKHCTCQPIRWSSKNRCLVSDGCNDTAKAVAAGANHTLCRVYCFNLLSSQVFLPSLFLKMVTVTGIKKKKECNKKKIKRLRIRIRTDMKYIPIHLLQALPRQPEVRCPQEVSYVLQVQPRLQLIDASVFPKPMERGKTHTMLPWDICSQQIQKL